MTEMSAPTEEKQVQGGLEDSVLHSQKVRFGAMISGNKSTLNSVLADELSYTHATGKNETKAEFITAITSQAVTYEAIEPEEVKARIYRGIAVVTGRAGFKLKTGNDRLSFRTRFTEVDEYRDGRWQLVAWQSTRLPEP
jgi:hypothetical protein